MKIPKIYVCTCGHRPENHEKVGSGRSWCKWTKAYGGRCECPGNEAVISVESIMSIASCKRKET